MGIKKITQVMGLVALIALFLAMGACTSPKKKDDANELTLGRVQKEIKVGMSSGNVVQVLGSPNMVTADGGKGEVWIYDKVSTQVSRSSMGAGLIFFASTAEESSRTQKTFTVIIKFNKDGKVRDISYHTSKF